MLIGNVNLKYGLLMAPMAGYSNGAFRKVVLEQGCELAFTEMVSVKSLIKINKKSKYLIKKLPGEKSTGIQLFGGEPEEYAEAVSIIGKDFKVIDINMGCPVPKVIRAKSGVFLMRYPEQSKKIMLACTKVSKVPVTIKIRTGWSSKENNCVTIAKIAEDCGISAVTVHGRTKDGMFRTPVDFDSISKVKKNVKIPVIGNGGINSYNDYKEMIEKTDCDGIMIGRSGLKKPWIFKEILTQIKGKNYKEYAKEEIINISLRHLNYLIELYDGNRGVKIFRKSGIGYFSGMPNASYIRDRIVKIETLDDFMSIVNDIK